MAGDIERKGGFECKVDETDGVVLKYREDVEGHSSQADHDGYAVCGL